MVKSLMIAMAGFLAVAVAEDPSQGFLRHLEKKETAEIEQVAQEEIASELVQEEPQQTVAEVAAAVSEQEKPEVAAEAEVELEKSPELSEEEAAESGDHVEAAEWMPCSHRWRSPPSYHSCCHVAPASMLAGMAPGCLTEPGACCVLAKVYDVHNACKGRSSHDWQTKKALCDGRYSLKSLIYKKDGACKPLWNMAASNSAFPNLPNSWGEFQARCR